MEPQIIELNRETPSVVIDNGFRFTITAFNGGIEIRCGSKRIQVIPVAANTVGIAVNGHLGESEIKLADEARKMARL